MDNWKPPAGSWEDEVAAIDTIEENWDPAEGKNIRQAYIVWSNGRKTRHFLTTLNEKCPQKVCLKSLESLHSATDLQLDAFLL